MSQAGSTQEELSQPSVVDTASTASSTSVATVVTETDVKEESAPSSQESVTDAPQDASAAVSAAGTSAESANDSATATDDASGAENALEQAEVTDVLELGIEDDDLLAEGTSDLWFLKGIWSGGWRLGRRDSCFVFDESGFISF